MDEAESRLGLLVAVLVVVDAAESLRCLLAIEDVGPPLDLIGEAEPAVADFSRRGVFAFALELVCRS